VADAHTDLHSSTFLVTGSAGCIGAWVTRELALRGAAVAGLDAQPTEPRLHRLWSDPWIERVTCLTGDVATPGVIDRAVEQVRATHVIHLASPLSPAVREDPILGAESMIIGTLRVLDAARLGAAPIKRVVYASSAAASADGGYPDTMYGVYKACEEGAAQRYWEDYGVASIGLRPCVVYGPGRESGASAGPSLAIRAVARGEPYEIPFGRRVDLQYVGDVASAFVGAALAELDGAHVCDLAGDQVSVPQFVSELATIDDGATTLVTWKDVELFGTVDMDPTRLRELVPGLVRTPLHDGIAITRDHYRAHRST
jgi:nucleoside-diphosphate-sugar epimerase